MSQDHRTRAQRQAEDALACVKRVAPADRKEYKGRADGFPVMVLQAGLAQAVGFMLAKAKDKAGARTPYGRYLDDLAAVISGVGGEAFQQKVVQAPLPEYRRLTRETLAVAGWFKRFGQAYLAEKEQRT